jgi:hypothetical protein
VTDTNAVNNYYILKHKLNIINLFTPLFHKQTAPFCFLIKILHQFLSLPRLLHATGIALSLDLLSQGRKKFSGCRWIK